MTPEERFARYWNDGGTTMASCKKAFLRELREAVEEENKRVIEWVLSQPYIKEARADALEEVEKICLRVANAGDGPGDPWYDGVVHALEEIRALKEKK